MADVNTQPGNNELVVDPSVGGGIIGGEIERPSTRMNCLLPNIPSIIDANGKELKYIICYK